MTRHRRHCKIYTADNRADTFTFFELTNGYCGVISIPDDCECFESVEEYIERRMQLKFKEVVELKEYRDAKPEDAGSVIK